MALYDDPNSMQGILSRPYTMQQQIGAPQTPTAPTGPAPLTPQQLAFQQAQQGTPLPQGFNPSMIGGGYGGMGAMPMPQGAGGAVGGLGMGAQHIASMGGLGGTPMSAGPAGQGMLPGGAPQAPQAPVVPGGAPIPSTQPTTGMSPQLMGMGAGMNPAFLKLLMGAGNGTA
ncbi:MAG TPA: hypothetical protein VJ840_18560 [Gemmatimonadaceae bacterium]|nr:hypothetical protein [Gemmatimonadaceae bacterium]